MATSQKRERESEARETHRGDDDESVTAAVAFAFAACCCFAFFFLPSSEWSQVKKMFMMKPLNPRRTTLGIFDVARCQRDHASASFATTYSLSDDRSDQMNDEKVQRRRSVGSIRRTEGENGRDDALPASGRERTSPDWQHLPDLGFRHEFGERLCRWSQERRLDEAQISSLVRRDHDHGRAGRQKTCVSTCVSHARDTLEQRTDRQSHQRVARTVSWL